MKIHRITGIILAVLMIFTVAAGVPENKDAAVHCDISGYEDFYYFPVTNCDGESYYFYVYNFGDNCKFSMDTDGRNAGFQYKSVWAVTLPASESENISVGEMNGYLKKFDFSKMTPDRWDADITTDTVNRNISVMKSLRLTGQYNGDPDMLSESYYGKNKIHLENEIVPYEMSSTVIVRFFEYSGKTVAKISVTDFSALGKLAAEYKNGVPPYEKVKKAYEESSYVSGYYYCDPALLEDYFGTANSNPSKIPGTYYTSLSDTPFPSEKLKGKKLDYFLNGGSSSWDEYYSVGDAAVAVPDELSDLSLYMDLLYYKDKDGAEFRFGRTTKEDGEYALNLDGEYTVKIEGELFGAPCYYFERFSNENVYYAYLFFEIDGNYYDANATVSKYTGWGKGFRKKFRLFFGSLTLASKLPEVRFGKVPEKYFGAKDIPEKNVSERLDGLKLYIPEGMETDGLDDYFTAYYEDDILNKLRIHINSYDALDALNMRNYHRREIYEREAWLSEGLIELKKLYNFRRNGADCTLSIENSVDFSTGRAMTYTYEIDLGDRWYTVTVVLPENSDTPKEEVFRILTSAEVV